MNRDRDDDRVRACFDTLRQADEASVPPFERVWGAARARAAAGRAPVRRRLVVAAVVAFLAAGSALLLVRGSGPDRRAAAGMSIGEWRSPTAALLACPGGGRTAVRLEEEALSAPAGTRFVTSWSSPTASLLRPPGGESGWEAPPSPRGRPSSPSSADRDRRES